MKNLPKINSFYFHIIINYFALLWHGWHGVCNIPSKHDANTEGITAYHARGRGFESRLCRLGFSFNGRVAQLGRARIFLHPLLQRVPFRANAGWFTG